MADGGFREQVASGDQVVALRAVRDRLASELEVASGAAVASLSKQLADVLKSLAGLETPKEASPVDDLAARRRARRAKAAGQ